MLGKDQFLLLLLLLLPCTLSLAPTHSQLIRHKRFISSEEVINVVATMLELWDLLDSRLSPNGIHLGSGNFSLDNVNIDLGFLNRKQAMLTQSVLEISRQLDRLDNNLAYSVDFTINSILSAMPKIIRTELRLHSLRDTINQIILQDRELQRYLTNQSAIERHTLEDWAAAVSGHHRDSIRNLMATLHADVIDSQSVFRLIHDMDSKQSICELQQSQQQMIYNLYNMISLAELKGYTMLQFAWMLLKIYDKGNFKTEADLMRTLYTERTMQKMNAAKEAMAGASRSVYRCDPRSWVENETYLRLTKLLQGYIENEVNLNGEGTCGQNCAYYTATRYHGCFKQQFCSKQPPCRGEIIRCTYYDSDMNICQSSSEERRYDWIEYENRMILGNKKTCAARNLHKVDSWWRYLFWHCSYCMCLCDDSHHSSDRYFSLRVASSNVTNNKVITGVRFVKDNQIIHIQIQEGTLLPRGLVNKTTTSWVPIQSFKTMDEDVVNGVDFFTMNHTNRGVDLDDAEAPAEHVVTGVRMRKVGPHLNMEIAATPFDYETGKVHPAAESVWISNDNTDGSFDDPRKEVTLTEPDIPTRKGPHTTFSRHDQFIKFRESSLKSDVSQSTVPYLDAQPLESGGLILAGLGLHHKGSLNSGGLIALKLITYDYSSHMIPQTPVV